MIDVTTRLCQAQAIGRRRLSPDYFGLVVDVWPDELWVPLFLWLVPLFLCVDFFDDEELVDLCLL